MEGTNNGKSIPNTMQTKSGQAQQYENDGYLIIDPEIPEAVLDGVLNDVGNKYNTTERINVSYKDANRIQDAYRVSKNVKAVALAPKILQLLEELYQRKPLPFQTLNFPKGTEQAVHSDTVHFNSIPSGYMCGVWIALEDMDMNNGPVVYYPGSHKLPEPTPTELAKLCGPTSRSIWSRFLKLLSKQPRDGEPTPGGVFNPDTTKMYAAYERDVADRIEKLSLKPFYATLKKGQALIWSANILHGGSPQKDKSRTRHSQVTHYFFEGCRYYTPLFSAGIALHWRRPQWIK